jgi:transcriptional regulator with XRE-family HTH domain
LLRQLRMQARLTQEELAEQAGLSPRSVSDLERGINRTARKDSAMMLAGALKLSGAAAEVFVAAARGKAEPAEVLAARMQSEPQSSAAAATRTLPRDLGGFTGRERELAGLEKSLAAMADSGLVSIHAIDGMAGIGKTTFAVHAAHRLADRFPDGQFFLPLHAHTAGQPPVDPADAPAWKRGRRGGETTSRARGSCCSSTTSPGTSRCDRSCRAGPTAWCSSPAGGG